jgi:hypothetical protein
MAGTGHPYEIVNRNEAISCLAEVARAAAYDEAKQWLVSKTLIKTITAPNCVIKLPSDTGRQIIEDSVQDQAEREILTAKFNDGCDLRVFSRELLKHVGPDLRHIVDWLNSLPGNAPKMVRKLSRITYGAAVKHAENWVSDLAREASRFRGSELTEIILETSPGKIWVELLDRAALVGESAAMNHCVADFSDRLGNGVRIFSLRDHVGKSGVTVEVRTGSVVSGPMVGQIKGHSNLTPSQDHRNDIVQLLNHLGVRSEAHRDAEHSAIMRLDDGTWTSIISVAEQIEVLGCIAYRKGAKVYVISPTDLQSVIASIVGPALWWDKDQSCDLTVMAVGDVGKHSIAEQRTLAALANNADKNVTVYGAGYLIQHNDRWMPWIDSCERWELDGVEFLHRDGTVYLMSSSERRIVASISRLDKSKYLKVNGPDAAHTASAAETRRLAALMSALDVEVLGAEAAKTHHGLRQIVNSNKWFYMPDHVVHRDGSIKKTETLGLKWAISPWHATLSASGVRDCEIEFAEGVVGHVRLPFHHNPHVMTELCRMMNELRLVPGRNRIVYFETGKRQYVTLTAAQNNQPPYGVAYVRGRWRRFFRIESFKTIANSIAGEQFANASFNEAAIELATSANEIERNEMLAAHLGAWTHRVETNDLCWSASGYWALSKSAQNTPTKRLVLASSMFDLMNQKDRARVVKAASTYIKSVIGRTQRPKVSFLSGGVETVRDLMLGLTINLPEKVLSRGARWFVGGYTSVAVKGDAGYRLDPKWFDIRNRLDDGRFAYGLRSRLSSDIWSIKSNQEKIDIRTTDEANAWIAACEMVAYGSIYDDSSLYVLSLVTESIRERQGEMWDVSKEKAEKAERQIRQLVVRTRETMAA